MYSVGEDDCSEISYSIREKSALAVALREWDHEKRHVPRFYFIAREMWMASVGN